ncbi:DUF2029 domain-containing protein [bacterium]|nr:DUF2029 domain-containing protein [bacterium]
MLNKQFYIHAGIILIGLFLLLLFGIIFEPIKIMKIATVAPFYQVLIMLGIIISILIYNLYSTIEIDNTKKLIYISLIILFGFTVSIIYCCYQGLYLNRGYPFNTILFVSKARFSDFINLYNLYYDFSKMPLTFLPLSFAVIKPLTLLKPYTALSFWFYSSIVLYFVYIYKNTIFTFKNINTKFIHIKSFLNTLLFILAYPFLFCMDRGNYEITLLFVLLLFLWLYRKEKYLLSAIVLSFAINVKFYPFLFLVLFLSDRKYKEFFYCILLTIFPALASLGLYTGDYFYNLCHFGQNDNGYTLSVVVKNAGFEYNSTLYGFLKYFLCLLNDIISPELLKNIYTYLGSIFILFTTLYTIFVEKSLWKKVTLIVIMRTLFVFVSAYYSLVLFIIPMWLFIKDKTHSKNDLFYAVCFGMLMIPYNYLLIYHESLGRKVAADIGVLIFPIIILFVWSKIIYDGIKPYIRK